MTFIWGTADPAVSAESARGCELFVAPGQPYRFVPLPGVSHWVPDERPDVVADEALAMIGNSDTAV